MGKASKFFKTLFGFKSPDPTDPPPFRSDLNKLPKRRWSFVKSRRDERHHHFSNSPDPSLSRPRQTPLHHLHSSDQHDGTTGSNNHATAVATAAAAVAEAAFAAAHAAAEVVRMTSRTTTGYGHRREWAAVIIQSYFRSYLAKKALRALKALVKLQALVRGHILRKQAADDYRRLQALMRVQKRAQVGRFHISDSTGSYNHHHEPPTPEKFEHIQRLRKHNLPSIPKNNGSRRSLFQLGQSQSLTTSGGSTTHPPGPSPSPSPNGSREVNSHNTPFKRSTHEVNKEVSLNSSPFSMVSAKGNGSMRVSPFTPAKSESSRSCLSGYSDQPNYMAYTESSRAKVRSVSAPRQRLRFELPITIKRYSAYGYGSGLQHSSSNLRDSFVSKAYPGSGRLDRLGTPVGGIEHSGSIWN